MFYGADGRREASFYDKRVPVYCAEHHDISDGGRPPVAIAPLYGTCLQFDGALLLCE